jgi:hypothetical protein
MWCLFSDMVISDCLFKDCDVEVSIVAKDDYGAVAGRGNCLSCSVFSGNSESVSEFGGAGAVVLSSHEQYPS